MRRAWVGWPLAALLCAAAPQAQVIPDSLWQQELEGIGVRPGAVNTVPAVGGASVRQVPLSGTPAGPQSVAEVARQVPSAHVQTNSRGEALVYLRGSGERQLVVTLDGAPLTISWDRRADLGLIPTGALDRIVVATGTPSVAWGPNALGGAVDLVSRRASGEGTLTEASLAGGVPGTGRASAVRVARGGPWSATLAVEAGARAGDAVATGASLPFSQEPGALRTNTDRALGSGLARLEWAPEASQSVALTLFHASAQKGVAPEGHLDPATESVRYWRLPRWRQSLAVLNARADARLWRVRGTAWAGAFAQTIRQFDRADYQTVGAEQRDADASGGLRALAEFPRAWGVIRATTFGEIAEHVQTETGEPRERFRHATGSVGLEVETEGRVRFAAGTALDGMAPLATGARPEAGPFGDLALHAGAVWDVAPEARLRIGGGRKTRFPSMRELFGGALGRFALNPDLRPEQAWLAEVGADLTSGPLTGSLVAFVRDVSGTIEQVSLADGRHQRQNLGGSTAFGVEATADWRAFGAVRIEAALTLVRQRTDAGERLTERPGALGRVGVDVARGLWRGRAWADGVGGVVSPVPGGRIDLPGAVVLSAELARQWSAGGALLETSVRVDNLADAVLVPQAGLPAPGRSASAGVRVLF
ncbi:TonB-dependent receptor plug domain-containing protein [Rubricoccus marinus]|uniref:TonB-dependent receptor plug domain-containing protein n=1 Tax=Rubricoccus marinus TaxID=716817 RepID=A0A259TZ55_9BACT|nr:TonB-dependent receptor [Rubricoccus marinus]OZC03001.1 hypothetical protein BSZ36_08475 [Rubricoccus marinus]